MWKDVSFLSKSEKITSEDLLQFQVSLNRKLSHALSYIRNDQIINIEANKITTNEALIQNAQIGSLEANKITTNEAKIKAAQIDTITANQINTGTLTGVTITGTTIIGNSIIGNTITGGVFQTNSNINSNRIVISNNSFATYKGANLHGLVFGEGYGDFEETLIYDEGTPALSIFAFVDQVYLEPLGSYMLNIGWGGKDVMALGNWNFGVANISGINLSNNGTHFHTGSTNNSGTHDHGIPNGTVLMVNGGGTVTWSSEGGHSHSLTTSVAPNHTHTIS